MIERAYFDFTPAELLHRENVKLSDFFEEKFFFKDLIEEAQSEFIQRVRTTFAHLRPVPFSSQSGKHHFCSKT